MDTPKEDGGATSRAERHVVVPVEATEEMLRAGQVAVDEPAAPLVGLRRLGNAYRAMLSVAPPVQMEAEPVGYQWLHIDQHTGAEFWHHNPRYNGEDSEVKRPVYASPIPSSSERSALLKCEEALRAAKQLCDNINEFGHVTDQEYHDAAEAQIRSALSLLDEARNGK